MSRYGVSLRIYRVSGRMRIGMEWRKFTIYITATKPKEAIETVYSNLGSRHKLKRELIKIEDIKEVSKEEVERVDILQLLSMESLTKW